jgi:hypothetical protein
MKKKKYKFRNKIFECDEQTIKCLNYALALNGSSERYIELKDGSDQ